MNAHQMRFNQVTGRWVIYATGRGKRPHDFSDDETRRRATIPTYDPVCPFCPGNEDRLTTIRVEHSLPGADQWQTRVVLNKYPVLDVQPEGQRSARGLFVTAPARGQHEVIIESPRHDTDLAYTDVETVEAVIDTYHQRYCTLLHLPETQQVVLFRNHGELAGTSLRHPHAQIVATSVTAQRTRQHGDLAERYHHQKGSDLVGDMARQERAEAERVVMENESFVAFVPFAAEVPYEMWIVPLEREADFSRATTVQRRHLARMLRDLLRRLHDELDDPDYNLIFQSAPRYEADAPYLRWYVRIRPRMITRAGFELGSGVRVNPTLPEHNAKLIRQAR
ncbi:MAG: galactose-1-phosphate uridylyltransferase [Phototrophicaceae bacterium]